LGTNLTYCPTKFLSISFTACVEAIHRWLRISNLPRSQLVSNQSQVVHRRLIIWLLGPFSQHFIFILTYDKAQ